MHGTRVDAATTRANENYYLLWCHWFVADTARFVILRYRESQKSLGNDDKRAYHLNPCSSSFGPQFV